MATMTSWAFFLALKILLWWLVAGIVCAAVLCTIITIGKRRLRGARHAGLGG